MYKKQRLLSQGAVLLQLRILLTAQADQRQQGPKLLCQKAAVGIGTEVKAVQDLCVGQAVDLAGERSDHGEKQSGGIDPHRRFDCFALHRKMEKNAA